MDTPFLIVIAASAQDSTIEYIFLNRRFFITRMPDEMISTVSVYSSVTGLVALQHTSTTSHRLTHGQVQQMSVVQQKLQQITNQCIASLVL